LCPPIRNRECRIFAFMVVFSRYPETVDEFEDVLVRYAHGNIRVVWRSSALCP